MPKKIDHLPLLQYNFCTRKVGKTLQQKRAKNAKKIIKRDTQQIFDLILKRLMRSSSMAVVQFINGLFGADHPLDSVVEYPNTENVSRKLRRLLSDMVIIINKVHAYHLEAEISDDENIVIRMFKYGLAEGLRTKTISGDSQKISVRFPNARIIYWETTERTPDEVTLSLEFSDGGSYDYVVKAFKFLDYDTKDLEEKKLALLLPFYVLKLRKRVVSAKSSTQRAALSAEMKAMLNDIISAAERAIETGLMNETDGRTVVEYTEKLYKELYQGYDELKEADAMLKNRTLTYSEEAELKGIEKGREEGREKGRKEGREEGREKGRKEGKEEVARSMLARGMALSDIAEIAGLSMDRVQALTQS